MNPAENETQELHLLDAALSVLLRQYSHGAETDLRVTVDGKPFFMKGVGYQPVPIGKEVGYPIYQFPEIYERDIEFLRSLG